MDSYFLWWVWNDSLPFFLNLSGISVRMSNDRIQELWFGQLSIPGLPSTLPDNISPTSWPQPLSSLSTLFLDTIISGDTHIFKSSSPTIIPCADYSQIPQGLHILIHCSLTTCSAHSLTAAYISTIVRGHHFQDWMLHVAISYLPLPQLLPPFRLQRAWLEP